MGHYQRLIPTEPVAHQGQNHHPDTRPQNGEEAKQQKIHASKSGRQGNVLANSRQQPADKGADMPVIGEEAVGFLERPLADQEIAAVSVEERSSVPHGEPVIEYGSQETACNTREEDQSQVHFAHAGKIASRGNNHLAGKREKGGLQKHQDPNARIAPVADGVNRPGNELVEHRFLPLFPFLCPGRRRGESVAALATADGYLLEVLFVDGKYPTGLRPAPAVDKAQALPGEHGAGEEKGTTGAALTALSCPLG